MENKDYRQAQDIVVDIVIPVYHAGRELTELIARLHKQDMEINQIILMHTLDGEDLSHLAQKYRNIRIEEVRPEEFDHGGTRDRGMRMSSADIVVCMTQDAVPADRSLIRKLVSALDGEQKAVAYGRQLPAPDCHVIERYTRHFNYPGQSMTKSRADIDRLGIKTYFCSNVCAAYKREIYLELGGFEHKTIFNEDMIFAAKVINAGYEIIYAADAKVIHSHNYSNRQQFKRNFDMAVSQKQHPEIFAHIKSETEGVRLVKQTAGYLLKTGHPFLIVNLILSSGAKYLGYRVGKIYQILPRCIINVCTMNPKYWG